AMEGFEARKQQIDEQIAQVRQRMTGGTSAPTPTSPQTGRRTLSAAGRKRLSDLMRKRWAAKRVASTQAAAPAAKKTKRRLSPEGRRRIIEATKKRWAAIRAAKKKGK